MTNKKGFVFLALLWIIPLIITCITGAYIGIQAWNNYNEHRMCIGSHCFTVEKNCTTVYKRCTAETGCGSGIQYDDLKINNCESFSRTCSDLNKIYGSDVYFISGTECMSCADYYQTGSVPSEIKMAMFPSMDICVSNLGNSDMDCLEINNEEDCKKVASATCVNPVTFEKYCGSKPIVDECPDIKIGGVLPFPDIWCKIEKAVTSFFMPLKIIITLFGAITSWLLILITLNNLDISGNKKTKRTISWTLSIMIGVGTGILLWFYFEWGLLLFILSLIIKLFIWK